MGRFSRQELEEAHRHYVEVANRSAASGDWAAWADLFTDDATYVEHHFGTFSGREAIERWITDTMAEWPNSEMTAFPHDWCICDEERGWWVCRILNRMKDPGDHSVHEEANLTVLHYAGNGRFSYEEDVYNPASFGPMLEGWMAARQAAG